MRKNVYRLYRVLLFDMEFIIISCQAKNCRATSDTTVFSINSRMPSAFLLRDARHATHDIFICISLI